MPEMLTLQSIPSYAKPGVACDNESTYACPATSDGWYRIHDTIRMEMVKFAACLKAANAPLQAWQVASLQAYWAGHEQLVHSHHEHEDKLFTPMLKERIDFPEKLEADHDALLELMADVAAAVKALKAGGDVSDAMAKFEAYKVAMEPHLVEEQNVLVPLMRAYFPFVEVNKRVGEIMKKMDPVLTGAFVHSFAGKKEFMAFMAQEKIPFFVWYIAFKSQRALYREKMETHVEALLTGVAPGKPLTRKAELQTAVKCGAFAWRQAK